MLGVSAEVNEAVIAVAVVALQTLALKPRTRREEEDDSMRRHTCTFK